MKLAAFVILGLLSFSGGVLTTTFSDMIGLNMTVCHTHQDHDFIKDEGYAHNTYQEHLEVKGLELMMHISHGDKIGCTHPH
jgi:hypothetical protein